MTAQNNPPDDDRDGLEKAFDSVSDRMSNIFNKLSNIGQGESVSSDVIAFNRAVKLGKTAEVKRLLDEKKVTVDTRMGNGDTALHVCAKNNRPEVAALLLEAGANPRLGTASDPDGLPLETAVTFGNVEVVNLLTRHGGYVPGHARSGRTLLHRAAEKGKPQMVEALIKAGASANEPTENGSTPLLIALSYRQEKMAEMLLGFPEVAEGINGFYTRTDALRRTAFQIAVERNQTNAVARMIALGGDVNTPDADGVSPLMRAIEQENPDMVRLLAQNGASLNKADGGQSLPLFIACRTGDIADEDARAQIVKTLLAAGADPEIFDEARMQLPLHAALQTTGALKTVQALLEAGANPDARDKDTAKTPLMTAVLQQSPEAVAALLKAGANPALTDVSGKSALSYARAAAAKNPQTGGIVAALEKALDARAAWPKPSAAKTAAQEFKEAANDNAQSKPAAAGKTPAPKKDGGKTGQSWDL
jgi:ankyrin repeat protein